MNTYRYTLCDVFTDQPLTGNALAVFTNAAAMSPATMQAVAREMNLSETVFVLPPQTGGHFRIRIFTPRREVPFAGHPTLGAALVIGHSAQLDTLLLETGKGHVPVAIEREAATPVFGWMTQPKPTVGAFEPAGELLSALALERSLLPIEVYDNGVRHVLVAADTKERVARLSPDLGRLASLPFDCVSVFNAAGASVKTRVFAPAVGVNEDPATGSAAGPLGWHLLRHGLAESEQALDIEQGAEIARPSRLRVRVKGSANQAESIEVGGQVVVVGRGQLKL
ncbi:MAG TPA: PhzF family phenazine biosynthesis protein [Polyangiaceae bacterium]